jgi:hypothetical protein|tara:strand:+ start:1936 stop:2085 length:150 start_codon:yes stop_codon:yes gene_type:complete
MGDLLKTFSTIFAIAVISCVIVAGGFPILIFAILGYAAGMYFIDDKLNK